MSWEVGVQKYRESDINERIAAKEGFLEEKEAKLLLYEFLRDNTTFSVDLVSGVKLFPFQHMAIKAMMETDYFLGGMVAGYVQIVHNCYFCLFRCDIKSRSRDWYPF